MKPYPNEELERMSKREIIRLYKQTVDSFNDAVPIAFIKSEMKYTEGVYPKSLRIMLEKWERKKNDTHN